MAKIILEDDDSDYEGNPAHGNLQDIHNHLISKGYIKLPDVGNRSSLYARGDNHPRRGYQDTVRVYHTNLYWKHQLRKDNFGGIGVTDLKSRIK